MKKNITLMSILLMVSACSPFDYNVPEPIGGGNDDISTRHKDIQTLNQVGECLEEKNKSIIKTPIGGKTAGEPLSFRCQRILDRYKKGNALGQQSTIDSGGAGVTHTHNGVAHTHSLPEGGLGHSHNYKSSY